MTNFRDYIKNRDNLKTTSIVATLLFLLLVFILTQLFGFQRDPEEEEIVRIELRERPPKVRPKLKQKNEKPKKRKAAGPPTNSKQAQKNPAKQQEQAKPKVQTADISSLVKSFTQMKVTRTTTTMRQTRQAEAQVTSMNTTLTKSTRSDVSSANLSAHLSSRPTNISGGRRGAPSASQSASVPVGGGSSQAGTVQGVSSGLAGGAGNGRATRSTGGGGGGASISIPGGAGDGEEAAIDIHDLIKWMKAHPGKIPLLVGYEMGHKEGADLSSAVNVTMNGRSFTMFLSCNEKELLLRICMVENNEYTLLKDAGISEASNFLTSGGVIREASAIKSLISSRSAPAGKADAFYDIFWGWWEIERAKM